MDELNLYKLGYEKTGSGTIDRYDKINKKTNITQSIFFANEEKKVLFGVYNTKGKRVYPTLCPKTIEVVYTELKKRNWIDREVT